MTARERERPELVRAREQGRRRGIEEERGRVVAIVAVIIAFDAPVGLIVRGIESGVSAAGLASRLRLSDRKTAAGGEPTYGPDKELDTTDSDLPTV